jgi:hypothetical protein
MIMVTMTDQTRWTSTMMSADNSLLSVLKLRKEVCTQPIEKLDGKKSLIYPAVAHQQIARQFANQLHNSGETCIVTTYYEGDLFDHEVIGIG